MLFGLVAATVTTAQQHGSQLSNANGMLYHIVCLSVTLYTISCAVQTGFQDSVSSKNFNYVAMSSFYKYVLSSYVRLV